MSEATAASSKGAWVALLFSFLGTWEGVQLVAHHDYIDPPGTIVYCLGATYPYETRPVHVGEKFTPAQCEKFLGEDLPKYVDPLRKCIPTFDQQSKYRKVALVSAAYNLGPATVCRAVAPKLNAGNVRGACDALLPYVNASGKVLQGLINRRNAEHKLCLMED